MAKLPSIIAFDKKSARHYDENGFLHVEGCNISKACVNPYLGSEIPNAEMLGLDPKRIYQILRPAEELEKAADTCNMIPLLDAHIEIDSEKLEDEDIAKHRVGNTGQAGEFKQPYLVNDLVITNAGAIKGVESREQCELSCAYRYDIDLTPGTFEGMAYDGMMRNIRFNHVALVEEGRAGPDVMVKDSAAKLKEARMAKFSSIKEALKLVPMAVVGDTRVRVAMANDVIEHRPGHKDSKGNAAPYVIVSEKTGKVLWSGGSREEAKKNLGRIESYAKDDEPSVVDNFINALTKLKGDITKQLKPGASEEVGEILDDCTSAIDLAVHHLLDYEEGQGKNKDEKPAADKWLSVTADIAEREEVNPKRGKAEYGNVQFADPKNKKYPIDTPAHARAAASYFGMAKNRSQYSKEDQATIQSRITAAEKKFKIGKFAEGNSTNTRRT